MKGGRDEKSMMSPMFPRLHVSDTEKGGPRAPPRNKMALYEQLSVPTQRFTFDPVASTLPVSRNNAVPLVPVASLKAVGHERTAFPPFYIPPSTPADSDDNLHSQSSDGMYSRTIVHKSMPKSMKLTSYRTSNASVRPSSTAECVFYPLSNSKNSCPSNVGNDNDFSVPTFVNPGVTQCSSKDQHNVDGERFTPLSSIQPSRSTETSGNSAQKTASATCNSSTQLHGARDKHLKRTNTTDLWSRQHVRNQSEENPLESVTSKDSVERTASHSITREQTAEPSKHTYVSRNQGHQISPFEVLGGLHDNDNSGHLQQDYGAGLRAENIAHSDGILDERMALAGKGNVSQVRSEFRSRGSLGRDRGSCNEYREDQIQRLLQVTDVDRNDDTSETSMVDSISGFDITPDDVVGVIGQKHFWKARRAIVNQQRLFAVQVFELHRLIKVQKLIAGSPHLLLEDTTYLTKPSLKASPPKKLSAQFLLTSPPQIVKQRVESQRPNQSTECAAENVVVKPPVPSVSGGVNKEHVNQQSSHSQHHGNPPPPPVTDGNKTVWSFHPPPGNQWLVPVMSPSEGLVYKPYTGPCPPTAGFMAPMYGGCGPMSLPSMGGEYPNPYGIPSPHHQGGGVHPNAPTYPQPYFSPYGMQMMNPAFSASSVEHTNPFAGAQLRGQAEHISTEETHNMHPRTSRNISNQKSEANSSGLPKFRTYKESEKQGSTASSPGERALKQGAGNVSEGRDPLPLFPMAPVVQGPDELPETQHSDQQHIRVIKVVPHNPRSATESAARIFQSIQEERQQYDSV